MTDIPNQGSFRGGEPTNWLKTATGFVDETSLRKKDDHKFKWVGSTKY